MQISTTTRPKLLTPCLQLRTGVEGTGTAGGVRRWHWSGQARALTGGLTCGLKGFALSRGCVLGVLW
jgi:hypothetical protein